MNTESFKKRALSIKDYLANRDIKINHSLALEILALANGLKNWDMLSAVAKKNLALVICLDYNNSETIRLLKNNVLPVDIVYCYHDRNEDHMVNIHPNDVELYQENRRRYLTLAEEHERKEYRTEMIKKHSITEDFYDLCHRACYEHRCLGKTKTGISCKTNVYSRHMDNNFDDFIKYYYHPKHFCKRHKNQIPISEKQKIAYLMKSEDRYFSYAHTSRELEVSVKIVREWFI